MPALLRGQAQLWTPGQVKPQGVPRIDWSHPLAAGLVFYGFDTGSGLIVDLVAGRPQLVVSGTTPAGLSASQWGAGFLWNNSDARQFNSDAALRSAPPFTWACAYVQTGTVPSGCSVFARDYNQNSSPFTNWAFEINQSGSNQNNVQASLDSGGSFLQIGSTWSGNANNVFTSLVGSAPSASTASFFAQGGLIGTSTGLSIQEKTTTDNVVFSGHLKPTITQQFTGFIFYGAFWNRALSAAEILQQHLDPYCFLLPAEGEMPALTLVSSALVGAMRMLSAGRAYGLTSGAAAGQLDLLSAVRSSGALIGSAPASARLQGASSTKDILTGSALAKARLDAASSTSPNASPSGSLTSRLSAAARAKVSAAATASGLARIAGSTSARSATFGKLSLAARIAMAAGARSSTAHVVAAVARITGAAKAWGAGAGVANVSTRIAGRASGHGMLRGAASTSARILSAMRGSFSRALPGAKRRAVIFMRGLRGN